MAQITSILLCFNYFSAYTIEIIIIITSTAGLVNLFFSKTFIPWYADSVFEEKVFIATSVLFLVTIIIIIFLILILRFLGSLNSTCSNFGFYLSIVTIFSSLFGLITSFIIYVFLLTNMKYYNYFLQKAKDKKDKKLISEKDWIFTIISLSLSALVWVLLLLSTMSDNLRIDLRINESYVEYLQAIEQEEKMKNDPNDSTNSDQFDQKSDKKKNKKKEQKKKMESKKEINIIGNHDINEVVNDVNNNKMDQKFVMKNKELYGSTNILKGDS